jgi:exopolysaccharide production protein ExoZ
LGELAFPLNFLFSPNNILFLFGAVAAFVMLDDRVPSPIFLTIFGIVCFVLAGLHSVYAERPFASSVYIQAFGLAAAVGILGTVTLESKGLFRVPRVFALLGDASYSIYLVNFPALSLGAKLLFASGLALVMPEGLSFVLLFVGGTVAGIVFYYLIEAPLVARFVRSPQLSDPAKA